MFAVARYATYPFLHDLTQGSVDHIYLSLQETVTFDVMLFECFMCFCDCTAIIFMCLWLLFKSGVFFLFLQNFRCINLPGHCILKCK